MTIKRKIGLAVRHAGVADTGLPTTVFAHTQHGHIAPDNFWTAWTFEPWVVAGIILAVGALYRRVAANESPACKMADCRFLASIAALGLDAAFASASARLGVIFSAYDAT